jgi:hypothetical protein
MDICGEYFGSWQYAWANLETCNLHASASFVLFAVNTSAVVRQFGHDLSGPEADILNRAFLFSVPLCLCGEPFGSRL